MAAFQDQLRSSPVARVAIGLETARQLGQPGLPWCWGGPRNKERGEQAAQTLRSEGLKAEGCASLVSQTRTNRYAVHDYFAKRYKKLDVLINNAASGSKVRVRPMQRRIGPATVSWKVLQQDVRRQFLRACALDAIDVAPHTGLQLQGASSMFRAFMHPSRLHSDPTSVVYPHKPFAYAASKSALNAFTVQNSLTNLRETPIKVNSAHPGWV